MEPYRLFTDMIVLGRFALHLLQCKQPPSGVLRRTQKMNHELLYSSWLCHWKAWAKHTLNLNRESLYLVRHGFATSDVLALKAEEGISASLFTKSRQRMLTKRSCLHVGLKFRAARDSSATWTSCFVTWLFPSTCWPAKGCKTHMTGLSVYFFCVDPPTIVCRAAPDAELIKKCYTPSCSAIDNVARPGQPLCNSLRPCQTEICFKPIALLAL